MEMVRITGQGVFGIKWIEQQYHGDWGLLLHHHKLIN